MARRSTATINFSGNPVQKAAQQRAQANLMEDTFATFVVMSSYPSVEIFSVEDGRDRQHHDADHHDRPRDERNGTLEDVAFGVAIDER